MIEHVSRLDSRYDVVVVGAGPAGMSAATRVAADGLSVLVLDENPAPGGQIYRAITRHSQSGKTYLGAAYWEGKPIADAFLDSSLTYAPGAKVWSLDPAAKEEDEPYARIGVSLGGASRHVQARKVILATGALERPMPVPGWTLPGVMTAGAAQIALKSAGLVPDGRVVLAGCGPLLYQLAAQLQEAGADIVTLLDTGPGVGSAWRYLPQFLFSPYVLKGLSLLANVRRRLRVVSGVRYLEIHGETKARQVRFETDRATETIDADLVLLHQGIIPDTALANSAGCALEWNESIRAFQPKVDAQGRSNHADIFVAGDGARVGGALVAAEQGRAVALAVLARLLPASAKRFEQQRIGAIKHSAWLQRGRPFIDAAYLPTQRFLAPADNSTLVCRCEEVTAGTVREAARRGVCGPNQLKTFTRCGMGPCQGRLCGPTVIELLAEESRISPEQVGTYRLRPPIKPLRLAELAGLPATADAIHAVTGVWPSLEETTKDPSHLGYPPASDGVIG